MAGIIKATPFLADDAKNLAKAIFLERDALVSLRGIKASFLYL